MSPLMRFLLIAITLSLGSTAADSKTINGTPPVLVGVFADRSEKCPEWNENEGIRVEFGSEYYDTCGGVVCQKDVVSHSVTLNGFTLNMREWIQRGKGRTYAQRIKVLDKDRDTIVFVGRGRPTTLHRCPF